MRFLLSLALALSLAVPSSAHDSDSSPTMGSQRTPADLVATILTEAPQGTRYGIVVQRMDGSELLAFAPEDRFMPASNTKIYTTLAAYRKLAALQQAAEGTGVRIEPVAGGVVDVILEGRGEATLSSAPDCTVQCLAKLADAVAARTRRVRNVTGDASWYPDERWSAGMSWNNIPFRYGTAASALTLDDNEFVLTVKPSRQGTPVALESDGYYRIDNRAATVAGKENQLRIDRLPGSDTLVLSGSLGLEAEPATYRLGLDDPAHRAAWRFAQMLEARGVVVTGTFEARYRPLSAADDPQERGGAPAAITPREEMIAQLAPEALVADVITINKLSQNLHAELMLRRVGKLAGSGSVADAQVALADMMGDAGLPEDAFVLADGSGMSSYNRLSPRSTAKLLVWAARQTWGAQWRETLPVGGVDGTLTRRFGDTPLSGRIFAKTGSLNASRALSGYVVAGSGEMLAFSAFANDIPPGGDGAATTAIDAALVAIAAAY